MKKLFLGAAIAMSSLTFAQQFGVKGGMNVSSISENGGLDDQGSKIGFNAGAFVNIPVAQNFSVQPELLFTQYGSKYDDKQPVTNDTYSGALHLNYVALPVMLQYNVTPGFYLEAGPEFGLLVEARNKYKNETTGQTINESGNLKDNINSFNFGVGLGAGYYFTPNIGINARYVAGLSDSVKDGYYENNENNIRNNVFQVGLTYKFGK